MAMVRLRRVSLERRHGNLDEAEALLEDAVKNAKNSSESTFFSVKLARQFFKVRRTVGKAKKVLLEAIEKDEVQWLFTTLNLEINNNDLLDVIN